MLERFKVPEPARVYVAVDRMRAATQSIFEKMGLATDDAALATDVLMANDLRGVDVTASRTCCEATWPATSGGG